MILEVVCKNQNATNWIIAGIKRRSKLEQMNEEICEEVAKELNLKFELKEKETYYFEDKQ